MSNLIVKSKHEPDSNASVVKVTPESAGWEYVGFEVLKLAAGVSVERGTGGEEVCLVPVSGACSVSSDSESWEIGGRKDPFDGPPHALYLPPGMEYRVEADAGLELAVCSAPAERGVEPFVVRPEDIEVEVRGLGNMEREIHPILMSEGQAERLLVTEVLTPNGHWSSYPPHKHDRNAPPEETYLEETYYHRVKQEKGFAVQRVYTDDRSLDETLTVSDGDVVLVPKGYHPVSAPPGYDLYYLNVMAGPIREWIFKNDPDHEWLF
ncbi:MAG: 5-deoxy-glucuronate isomerase [Rubrobacteraceae bacterium]